jgi:zinc transporter ZupT
MISYGLAVGGIIVATLVPAYIALYLIPSLKKIPLRYLAAFGVGLTFWFFFDTMGDASDLDVNQAVYPINQFGGYIHFAVICTFAAGITALAIFDHFAVPKPSGSSSPNTGGGSGPSRALVLVPIAVAAVMGIHGMGEGWDFAVTAASSSSTSLITTFGNLAALVSYPIHKFCEAAIIGVVYTAYVGRGDASIRRRWHIPVLGLLFGLTSVIGASIGYYITNADTTYFYAFGVTAALYAMMRLVEPMFPKFIPGDRNVLYLGPKMLLATAIGFFLLYSAALLH